MVQPDFLNRSSFPELSLRRIVRNEPYGKSCIQAYTNWTYPDEILPILNKARIVHFAPEKG